MSQILSQIRALLIPILAILPVDAQAQVHPAPTCVEVASGVLLFTTPPYGDVGLDGNSVAILSDEGVLVFDANGTPAAASAVLEEIRRRTDRPVRYLVLSHWHWDHWYGAEIYKRAFPAMVIISQERTRRLMAGPAIDFNQPGLDSQLPSHIRAVEEELAAIRAVDPNSPEAAGLEDHLARDRHFLEQKRGVRHTWADLTFSDSLTIHLGSRAIRVLHHDRAITPGDAFLYLPDERIVVTGDLLINPITFALFCYPAGWIRTLERIDALNASVLIPGHGAPMRDERILKATIELLRLETRLGLEGRERGLTVEQTKSAILADSSVLRIEEEITQGNAALHDAFSLYLVDWFVRRLYEEAEGPLDDSIPSTP